MHPTVEIINPSSVQYGANFFNYTNLHTNLNYILCGTDANLMVSRFHKYVNNLCIMLDSMGSNLLSHDDSNPRTHLIYLSETDEFAKDGSQLRFNSKEVENPNQISIVARFSASMYYQIKNPLDFKFPGTLYQTDDLKLSLFQASSYFVGAVTSYLYIYHYEKESSLLPTWYKRLEWLGQAEFERYSKKMAFPAIVAFIGDHVHETTEVQFQLLIDKYNKFIDGKPSDILDLYSQ